MKKILFVIVSMIMCLSLVLPALAEEESATEVWQENESIVEVEQEQEPQPIEILDKAEVEINEFIDKFFSADKIAMYLSWIAYIGTIIGLVANVKKLKQNNNLTLESVSKEISNMLGTVVSKEVSTQFDAIIPNLVSMQTKTNEVMNVFAKVLALSQENTPESRTAILNLIEELGTISAETIATAKTTIAESVKMVEQAKQDIDDKIDKIVESYDGTSI